MNVGTSKGQNIFLREGAKISPPPLPPRPRIPKWKRSNGDRPIVTGRPSPPSSESTAVVSPPLSLVFGLYVYYMVRVRGYRSAVSPAHQCFMPPHSAVSCFTCPCSMAASTLLLPLLVPLCDPTTLPLVPRSTLLALGHET